MLTFALALAIAPIPEVPDAYREELGSLLERAESVDDADAAPPPGNRELFLSVLGSDAFLHAAVGPIDVYVYRADGFSNGGDAREALDQAVEGLEPLVPVFERHFDREHGLVSGVRFPLVLTSASVDDDDTAFDDIVALLDYCEQDWTGWVAGSGPIWNTATRRGMVARNWEAMVLNVQHASIRDQGDDFYEHFLGYNVLAHVVNRLLKLGAWGNVPTWVQHGLVDEFDIEAYGTAWVGSDTFEWEEEAWFRPGWEGFLPEGQAPPPTITGPPADRARTVRDTSNPWDARKTSAERHWDVLVDDQDADDKGSFEFMMSHADFLPRDRAYARCFYFLAFHVLPDLGEKLLDRLDRPYTLRPDGMPEADPLTTVFAEVLGGVEGVDALEDMTLEEQLRATDQGDIADQLRVLGAEELLALKDHREQASWLQQQPETVVPWEARQAIWAFILAGEFFQQEAEWEPLALALDDLVAGALEASPRFPKKDRDREKLAQALSETREQ